MAAVAAVGMLDGVHRGHRAILDTLAARAKATGRRPLAFTFSRHPTEIISGRPAQLITSLSQRTALMSAAGVEPVVLDYSRADFALTAEQFLGGLREKYGVDAIVMGFNNHIGADRRDAGWIADNLPVDVSLVQAVDCQGLTPSSSEIRRAVSAADFACARTMLGHHFTVRGRVVEGNKIGRTIGFPTANIDVEEDNQLLPPDGSYIVDVHIGERLYRGMANIGTRPTIADGRGRTIEVNIFDFNEEIYGCTIDIDFLAPLRPEQTFPDLAALTARLALDRTLARNFVLE